ncbi:MAG: terpene cyclase/mutase family protein [Planctomycetaceae bacterium]|jgi:squalene-hopene/tetraprenyl-beta-curcumene cyclase|nr:terpene cyclase/mutase family protein [Planctomycetaceae bacterium]
MEGFMDKYFYSMNQNDSNENSRWFNKRNFAPHNMTMFYDNPNGNLSGRTPLRSNSINPQNQNLENNKINNNSDTTENCPNIPPSELRRAIASTQQFFFNHQHPDGYWVAELEGDALLQSETILLLAFLGEEKSELAQQCATHLLDTQLPDGGWGMYTGGNSDVNNTVKAYFALKITGHSPNVNYMIKARVRALELGGVDKVNSFTRFYLAILGQIPHHCCPAVPPQMMLLPKWFPINIYSMSAWSRTIFVPLSIVSALAPVRDLPYTSAIKELFIKTPDKWEPLTAPGKKRTSTPFSWDKFFRCCNSLIWACRKLKLTPLRNRAIESAKNWTLEHCQNSDGPGAIYPPIIWSWIALKSLGYADDSEEIIYFRNQLNSHVIRNENRNSIRIQPCKSPVWDTALTLKALMLGGLTASNPSVRRGLQWVRSRHIKQDGDWKNNIKLKDESKKISGWCFEFNNAFYPDNDDTAMALMVLAGRFDEANPESVLQSRRIMLREIRDIIEEVVGNRSRAGVLPPDLRLTESENDSTQNDDDNSNQLDPAETTAALESGLRWLLAMQNKDGGWGAFDRNNNKEILCKVPFADHNAMIDPSTPDLTGRVMESLGRLGFRVGQSSVIDRVVSYIKREQQADGSWFGRWGVNYIYGTWQALTGLTSVGVGGEDSAVVAGANWFLSHQHPSGGWGESPDSYFEPSLRGHGTPTASQTAWALMGLIAAGKQNDPAVQRGIKFLLDRQREDGTWYEPEFTGTGFPMVFYLKYHYYSVYFPLMALSLYAAKAEVPNAAARENETILKLPTIRVFSPEKEFYNNTRTNDTPENFEIVKQKITPKNEPKKQQTKPTLKLFLG